MGRREKPPKGKANAKRVPAPSQKNDASSVRELEKRLAESPEREKAKDRALFARPALSH